MSNSYQAVQWNPQKKAYDRYMLLCLLLYLAIFIGIGIWVHPFATLSTLVIRGTASAAFIMLNVILCIGPLCRLDNRFLPLLYNRRHMGVTMFLVALVHAIFVMVQYHSWGSVSPFRSLLFGNEQWASISQFPFQFIGLLAILILMVMALTSHDFWLANLTAPVWKTLHMFVYIAYALIIAHICLGALQASTNWWLTLLVALSIVLVVGLHITAACVENKRERELAEVDEYVKAVAVEDIPENRAKIVTLSGERVAIFKYEQKIAAVSNVCQHQNGPLGEGKVVRGCITCPWHGYGYKPNDGCSPPPFKEKTPTFNVKVEEGWVYVATKPNPLGTESQIAEIKEGT